MYSKCLKFILIGITSVFLLTGCGRGVVSNISVFHKLPIVDQNITIKYSFNKLENQYDSLEYETYKEKIKQYLLKNNYLENNDSSYLISFQYGIDNGKEKTGSVPVFGQTGVSSSNTYGTVTSYGGGYGSYSGTTIYRPTYGITGSSSYSYYEYRRFLNLYIYDKSNQKTIYEGKVVSSGSANNLLSVIDEMIESLFKDFPGESGKSKEIEIPFVE